MSEPGFTWFPNIKSGQRVLVFIDAMMGSLSDLYGHVVDRESMTEGQFFKVFDSREEALTWAKSNKPKEMSVIALLHDESKSEEYVPIDT